MKDTNGCQNVVTVRDTNVSQTTVGVTYLNVMEFIKNAIVLYTFTTDNVVHARTKTQHLHVIVW